MRITFFMIFFLFVNADYSKNMSSCSSHSKETGESSERGWKENCMSVDVKITDEVHGLQLLDDRHSLHIINIQFPSSWSDAEKGRVVDKFLTPRPWWMVHHERYNWSVYDSLTHGDVDVDVKLLRMSPLERPLRAMVAIQFPANCSSNKLHVRCFGQYNEYGNEHINTKHSFRESAGAIFDIFTAENAHWVDDRYCPNTANKFRCAFLPTTNCTTDIHGSCDRMYFSSGSSLSNQTTREEFFKDFHATRFPESKPPLSRTRLYRLQESFNFSTSKSVNVSYDVRGDMFGVALLFRMNHDYRSRVAHMVREFRVRHSFDENARCIAFHIRRGDRVVSGKDMLEHCAFIRQMCPQRDQNCLQIKYNYNDFGCPTAHPYGALNLSMYMSAVEVLVRNEARLASVRNVVVMTNDEKWAVEQSAKYAAGNWTFLVLPQPPHFRGSSVHHGVVNQMHLELVRQCSAFVSHMGSAFAMMTHQYMCFRHGPRNHHFFGKCPPYFDFS